MELIKIFVNENSKTKLFCVGDDWQSIYQFTGSDVKYFVNFNNYFTHPEISYLTKNYRSSMQIVKISNKLISNNKNQIEKTTKSIGTLGITPLFFQLSKQFAYSFKMRIPNFYYLIKILLDDGVKPSEIMILSRFNRHLKDLEIYCGANGIPTEAKHGGVRFYSVHKSKGSESEHVIIIDVINDMYGFPCEIQDPSVLELAKRHETKGYLEEERRLFYVALTRSKKFLYIFGIEGKNSIFLGEIFPNLKLIQLDTSLRWKKELREFIPKYINNKRIDPPYFCAVCGKFLEIKIGHYGKSLQCTDYPKCNYILDIMQDNEKKCPNCGRRLVERKGKNGKFLGCINYPKCKYILDLEKKEGKSILCPICRKRLILRKGKYGPFLGCIGYPKCNFSYNIRPYNKKRIYCPECGKPLAVRKGKNGIFIGCTGYPKCRFTFNIK